MRDLRGQQGYDKVNIESFWGKFELEGRRVGVLEDLTKRQLFLRLNFALLTANLAKESGFCLFSFAFFLKEV